MRRRTSRRAYDDQKRGAEKRSVPFDLTYEEWEGIWEQALGPDWFQMRGCIDGRYVMARLKDRGGYTNGNVKIITAAANQHERLVNGTLGNAHLTLRQVAEIRRSAASCRETAKKYAVSQSTIWRIRQGATY